MRRYTDQVRKVVKQCYEEAWAILTERKAALQAGVEALSDKVLQGRRFPYVLPKTYC